MVCGKYFTIVATLPCEEDILIRAANMHAIEALGATSGGNTPQTGGGSKPLAIANGADGRDSFEVREEGLEVEPGMGERQTQNETAPPPRLSTVNKAESFKSEWDASDDEEQESAPPTE